MKDKLNRIIPSYARIPLAFVVIINFSVYYFARILTKNLVHYSLENKLDTWIPFIPWMIFIYFGCYLYWIANYILVSHISKQHAIRFYDADILAKVICFICYVFYPTTMVRAEIVGNSISNQLVSWLYQIDRADNLFPSIHCLVSWLCFIGVRKQEKIPFWYRMLSFIFTVLICISTITLKQHVCMDVVAGIILAEICYVCVSKNKV